MTLRSDRTCYETFVYIISLLQVGPLSVEKQEALFSKQLSKFKTGHYSSMKSCVSARKVRSAHTIVIQLQLFSRACMIAFRFMILL
jgi:hypothetical protein